MQMMQRDEMHDMNKMQNKRQKPNHEGNNISPSRKWQELELQIWKVSGASVLGRYNTPPLQEDLVPRSRMALEEKERGR